METVQSQTTKHYLCVPWVYVYGETIKYAKKGLCWWYGPVYPLLQTQTISAVGNLLILLLVFVCAIVATKEPDGFQHVADAKGRLLFLTFSEGHHHLHT